MRAAFGAEFPRHGAFKIAARKLLGRALGVTEAIGRHEKKHVWRTAGDILAFAAMALRFHHWLAFGHVAYIAAIATAYQFHGISPTHFDVCGFVFAVFQLALNVRSFARGRNSDGGEIQNRETLEVWIWPGAAYTRLSAAKLLRKLAKTLRAVHDPYRKPVGHRPISGLGRDCVETLESRRLLQLICGGRNETFHRRRGSPPGNAAS
jgi:hypothetical protein